jgi:uncharacterized paraquat-inducible protein A
MYEKLKRPIPAILLLGSFILFVLGLTYPIMVAKSSVFGLTLTAKSVYLIDTIKYFLNENEWLMAFVILITTLIFPSIKYVDLTNRIFHVISIPNRVHSILSHLDKWSMTEVFIVALVILTVKTSSNFMSMEIRSGITFLTSSIILRMVSVQLLSINEFQVKDK